MFEYFLGLQHLVLEPRDEGVGDVVDMEDVEELEELENVEDENEVDRKLVVRLVGDVVAP